MVCFVILHYMALEETVVCVESILHNVEGEKRIIVVDNDSPNGSVKELRDKYGDDPLVDVLETGENLGFARGNNYGYRYAVEHYAPSFIVVMNNDMEIRQNDFIERMEQSYEEHRFAIMGPDIYSTKKKYHHNPQTRKILTRKDLERSVMVLKAKNAMRFVFPVKWFLAEKFRGVRKLRGAEKPGEAGKLRGTGKPGEAGRLRGTGKPAQTAQLREAKAAHEELAQDRSDERYVDHVVEEPLLHGSCYIFSEDFIKRHPDGCFYDKTFMYMEAEILYYQARRDGEKMIYDPGLKVDHHEDVATDATFKKQSQKSIFTVKCMLQSTKAFLDLMDRDGNV